jgi:hypothetical protein
MPRSALSFSLCLLLAAAPAVPAAAQDNFWGSFGDWDVSIDPTIDNGCYALASWNGGTVLRIGRNPQLDNFYFLIGNPAWSSLQPDRSYDLAIQFGNRPVWDVSANGLQFSEGEEVYLHAQSDKMDFIREFQKALNMKISFEGAEIDNLKLTGSSRAWTEVEKCQEEMNNRPDPVPDPVEVAVEEPPATEAPVAEASVPRKDAEDRKKPGN